MKMLKMYMVYDSKIEAYDAPFVALSDGDAERIIYEWMTNQQTNYGKYPADFNLFFCGEFDQQKGIISPAPTASLGTLLDIAIRWKNQGERVRKQLETETFTKQDLEKMSDEEENEILRET